MSVLYAIIISQIRPGRWSSIILFLMCLQTPMALSLRLGVLAVQKGAWQAQSLRLNFRGLSGSHGRSEPVIAAQAIWVGFFHQNLTDFMDLFLKN